MKPSRRVNTHRRTRDYAQGQSLKWCGMRPALQYQPDRDQIALASDLETPIAELLPLERLRTSAGCESASAWRQLEDLGVLTAGAPEEAGGSGLGATELSLMAIALGRSLASPAVIASLAARTLAPAYAQARAAAAFPGAGVWLDEPGAELVLARRIDGGVAIYAMPAGTELDGGDIWGVSLKSGELDAPLVEVSAADALKARLVMAAALAGIAEATLAMAVEYAKTRKQFGWPIGAFQAVKHHCANMAIAARSARDLSTFAAVAIDTGRTDAAFRTESAFLVAANAAIDNAGTNIQVHGAIGFSAEADPHHFLKRARLLVALGGGVEEAAICVADALAASERGEA
jgi:alkylation response protein AidB-like acyl-CoA dehydrogenase